MANDLERALVAVSSCLKRIVGRLFKLLEQGSQTLRQRGCGDDVVVFGAEPPPNLQQPFAPIYVDSNRP